MIIKNYCNSKSQVQVMPAADLQILEDVTDVFVHAGCFSPDTIGDDAHHGHGGPTSFYGTDDQPINTLTRHIDFTRHGIRCRLLVTNHAYICNDRGQTVEKVSA